jgi:hypothetical protein
MKLTDTATQAFDSTGLDTRLALLCIIDARRPCRKTSVKTIFPGLSLKIPSLELKER